MKILFFGDIIGRIGRQAIAKVLPELKKKYEPDLVIANAENLAHGIGITEKTIKEVADAGIDVFTSGNHIWDKTEAEQVMQGKKLVLLRPANYPPGVAGIGHKLLEIGTKKILIINLLGRVFFKEDFDCPFRKIDEILKEYKNTKLNGVIVDFHAEATSEKNALGWHTDGRVSAILGTHTHVPTADAKILPQGTAYVTDVGMVGARDSVIGATKEPVLKRFLYQLSDALDIPEEGLCQVNAVLIDVDTKTGLAKKIERLDLEVKI